MAQTSKSLNTLLWSLITTLDVYETRRIEETTMLAKFDNIESLLLDSSAKFVPQDLIKLTTLHKLQVNEAKESLDILQSLSVLQTLKNLGELNVSYTNGSRKLDDLLSDHTRLTKLEISAANMKELGRQLIILIILSF